MLRFCLLAPLALAVLAGCVARAPAPPPRPAPLPPPPPPRAPAPALPSVAWADQPVTPGDWVYRQDGRASIAYFGIVGASAALTLRCDRATGHVVLSRPGMAGRLTLTTTTSVRAYAAQAVAGAPQPYVAVEFAGRDPQLDAMVFSRGQFMVALDGGDELHLPTWPEVARVVEDCRG